MRRALAIVIALAVAGCTTLDPYETLPLKPPPSANEKRERVGICFGGWINDPEKVRKAAEDACGPNMSVEREDTDLGLKSLDLCPALLPRRATFICVPKR